MTCINLFFVHHNSCWFETLTQAVHSFETVCNLLTKQSIHVYYNSDVGYLQNLIILLPPINETEATHRCDSSTQPFHIMYRLQYLAIVR